MVQAVKNSSYQRYFAMAESIAKRLQPQGDGQNTKSGSKPYQPKGREVYDTIELSGSGKIVNLARGKDLAAEIRAEKDPDKVREMVKAGTADIKRIGRLFQETFRTLFSLFRGRPF